MFRRRRITVGVLAVLLVLALVWGISRLRGTGVDGVADAAGPTTTSKPTTVQTSSTTKPAAGSGSTAPKPSATPTRPMTPVPNGTGKFTAVPVRGADSTGAGRVVTYTVEVENGLKADGPTLASTVQAVLKSPQGWQGVDKVRFVHLDAAQVKAGKKPEVVVSFASPGTVDKLCVPLATKGKTSCASTPRAVLNYWRWINGVEFFGTDLTGYRQYMINHEVGHLLGHLHEKCPAKGKVAPVMSQQTLGLDGCTPNAWPTTAA